MDNDQEVVAPEGGSFSTASKMAPKVGYYYMYTLLNTMGSLTFVKEIDSGNEDVWIYEFADGKGTVGYALWCPTSNGTVVEDYVLTVNGTKAVLTEAVDKDIDGVQTNLQIENGAVRVTVSENPVYVVVQ